MANTTIGTVTLHDGINVVITDNGSKKSSDLTIMPLYSLDSDQTNVFDFGGTTKTFSLSGIYYSDTLSDIKTWIESLEALQQGHQDIGAGYPLTFTDDLRGTIKVKVLNVSSDWLMGEKSTLSWTLDLIQSSEAA